MKFSIYKIRRVSDGRMFGKKPRFRKYPYFGLPNKGKVFTRKIDADRIAASLNKFYDPVEVIEFECMEIDERLKIELSIIDYLTDANEDSPGGFKDGEVFLNTSLEPAFLECIRRGGTELFVDLDGVVGFATSFLRGSFGQLSSRYGKELVKNTLVISCQDEPYLIDDIMRYIDEAFIK